MPLVLHLMQEVNALTYEANAVTNRAEVEKQEVVKELSRLSELVLSFQQRIQQVGGGLWAWARLRRVGCARLCLVLLGWPRSLRTLFAPDCGYAYGPNREVSRMLASAHPKPVSCTEVPYGTRTPLLQPIS